MRPTQLARPIQEAIGVFTPGSLPVSISSLAAGLAKDSAVSIAALVTSDKADLDPAIAKLSSSRMRDVDPRLRHRLSL